MRVAKYAWVFSALFLVACSQSPYVKPSRPAPTTPVVTPKPTPVVVAPTTKPAPKPTAAPQISQTQLNEAAADLSYRASDSASQVMIGELLYVAPINNQGVRAVDNKALQGNIQNQMANVGAVIAQGASVKQADEQLALQYRAGSTSPVTLVRYALQTGARLMLLSQLSPLANGVAQLQMSLIDLQSGVIEWSDSAQVAPK